MYALKNEDLSDKAYSAIKTMILKGDLVPGVKLYQEKLAENLGISRTPLNSALNQLEKEMLVESLPRRGFNVKKLSLKELLDLYDVRLRLEPLGARQAAENRDPGLLKQCRNLQTEYERILSRKITPDFRELDYGFHNLIMAMSGNVFLQKMISSYNIISLGNLQLFMKSEGFPKKTDDSLHEHQEILGYIISHLPEEAESAMFSHIQGTRNFLEREAEKENHGETEKR